MDELGWTEEGKALQLWRAREAISHISLHSGIPDMDNELPDGIYRRVQIDFREPREGEIRSERKVVLSVPEGSTPTHAGFWNAPFGGVMLARGKLSRSRTFKGDGTVEITLAALDLNGGEAG